MKANNFLQDDKGNWSMARFAVLCCVIMGLYNGAFIPFVSDPALADSFADASIKYFGIAVAGKTVSKLTERG